MKPRKIGVEKLLRACVEVNSYQSPQKIRISYLSLYKSYSLTEHCTLRKNTFTTYVEASLCGESYKEQAMHTKNK